MNSFIEGMGITVLLLVAVCLLVYILSRLQMKAWLQEFRYFINIELSEYSNYLKDKKDETEEK